MSDALLSREARHQLLAVARGSIEAQVLGRAFEPGRLAGSPSGSGVFVTVRIGEELRGCLGTLDPRGDLVKEVARCAAEAASEDPRFEPVAPGELAALSIEISVLGPLERIDPSDPEAVRIGAHGLVVEKGRRRGLLLPQVASERGWTPEQFLGQTCVKAELPPDAWRRGAWVYRFTAVVFGE